MATGSKRKDPDGQKTWRRPEDTENTKYPEIIVSSPTFVDRKESSSETIAKQTVKVDVDKNKILSVTTTFPISHSSKRLISAKSKTDIKPKGTEQDSAAQSIPAESQTSPGSQKLRKSSIPASSKESKPPGPAVAKAKPSQNAETTSPRSSEQTANEEVLKRKSSEKSVAFKEDDNADETRKQDAQTVVTVQVIFYRFRDINTTREMFDAEIILNAKWPEPGFDDSKSFPDRLLAENEYKWSPELYIENVVGEPKIISKTLTLRYATTGQAFIIESTKLYGNFSEPMQLIDFPFDTQIMSLLVRTDKPTSEVHLTCSPEDPHIIRRSLYFQKQQFRLYMHVVTEDLTMVPYDEYGVAKTSDELRVKCHVSRNPVFYIINCYLIAFLLAFLGFVSFSADAKYTMQRNVLSFFLMLGAVSHKYTLVPHIPKTSYMTHADSYCLSAIIYLCLLSIWHAMMTLVEPQQRNNYDWIGIILFGGMLLLYNIGSWRVFLTTVKSNRAALVEEENKYIAKLIVLRHKRATIDNILSD